MCYDIVLFVLMSYDNAYAVLNLIQCMEKKMKNARFSGKDR